MIEQDKESWNKGRADAMRRPVKVPKWLRQAVLRKRLHRGRGAAGKASLARQLRDIQEGRLMNRGYARVSTDGQSVDAQVRQLRAAGAEKVYRETASGAKIDRAQLRRVLDSFRPDPDTGETAEGTVHRTFKGTISSKQMLSPSSGDRPGYAPGRSIRVSKPYA